MQKDKDKGSFTLPGESGYEKLTMELAGRWGADMIRDSDGTALSPELLNAGYGVYSTICIIRNHNAWARRNMGKLQQTFLISQPAVAESGTLGIDLMAGYFAEQFAVNDSADALRYWQVTDRTSGAVLPRGQWACADGRATIAGAIPWHSYTASFLAFRVWEEISMYNHTTNGWDREHLMQIDPIWPETQDYMLSWLEGWCKSHSATDVVRFTSLFYNFAWIWGSDARNRSLFADWASYDFTVSPLALDLFQKEHGYALTAEDFVNGGKFQVTHMPPSKAKLDWMDFMNRFVTGFGSRLVEVAHRHGKKAYVFYDDSWVGMEPYSPRFPEFKFDGLIKCVFSGFEARLCAGVQGVRTKELRLHPYLFPVGLGGAPTFMEGGDPARDARRYWASVRRALLRVPVDRIGLGGYLHLAEQYPDFVECIEDIAREFRQIKELHRAGPPTSLAPRVGVLTAWGKLRSWTCSGHLHENPDNDLINIIESLAGLPFDAEFLDFDEVRAGAHRPFDVLINAGFAGSAWSGGSRWRDDGVVAALTGWVHGGGLFLGVNAPSAAGGYASLLRMAPVLGVDIDDGARVNHGRWPVEAAEAAEASEGALAVDGAAIAPRADVYLTGGSTEVLMAKGGAPCITSNHFGKGRGIYLASYRHSMANARLLHRLIAGASAAAAVAGGSGFAVDAAYMQAFPPEVDCAIYPSAGKMALANAGSLPQTVRIGTAEATIKPYGMAVAKILWPGY
jgi:beta-D-galactosyl-(1->4)-L-rhamnose phosphorylase